MTSPETGTSNRAAAVDRLITLALKGDIGSVARLITLVENDSPALRDVVSLLAKRPGNAHVVGLTGAPGVGKSTSTGALISAYRLRGMRVGALVVDPSSPLSGGALLGDRIRMADHSGDSDVFVRSMASRGRLGGLSWTTPQAVRVLSAAGFDVILIETVGVGQVEVEVAALADTTLVFLAPGMGDSIQAAKAGILEVADILVVNKADRDGAHAVVRDLRQAQSARAREGDQYWRPPILEMVATHDRGVEDVVDAVERHRAWLEKQGLGGQARLRRVIHEVEGLTFAALERGVARLRDRGVITDAAARVVAGDLDPYGAAEDIARCLALEVPER